MSTVEPERSFVLGSRATGSAWESGELLLGTDGSPDFVNEGFINEGFVEVIEVQQGAGFWELQHIDRPQVGAPASAHALLRDVHYAARLLVEHGANLPGVDEVRSTPLGELTFIDKQRI